MFNFRHNRPLSLVLLMNKPVEYLTLLKQNMLILGYVNIPQKQES